MADFYIATEDRLSEALAEYIVKATGHSVAAKIPKDRRRHGGFGYPGITSVTRHQNLPFQALSYLP
jgi:hypothetical protein